MFKKIVEFLRIHRRPWHQWKERVVRSFDDLDDVLIRECQKCKKTQVFCCDGAAICASTWWSDDLFPLTGEVPKSNAPKWKRIED